MSAWRNKTHITFYIHLWVQQIHLKSWISCFWNFHLTVCICFQVLQCICTILTANSSCFWAIYNPPDIKAGELSFQMLHAFGSIAFGYKFTSCYCYLLKICLNMRVYLLQNTRINLHTIEKKEKTFPIILSVQTGTQWLGTIIISRSLIKVLLFQGKYIT